MTLSKATLLNYAIIIIFILTSFNSQVAIADEIPDQDLFSQASNGLTFFNETELIDYADNNSLEGDGSADNPFVFDGYSFTSDRCFTLLDTDLFVVISNSTFTIDEGQILTIGVYLINVQNFTIENCSFRFFDFATYLSNCSNIEIISSDFHDSEDSAIYSVSRTTNVLVNDCNFINGSIGLFFDTSSIIEVCDSIFINFSKNIILTVRVDEIVLKNLSAYNGNFLNMTDTNIIDISNIKLNNTVIRLTNFPWSPIGLKISINKLKVSNSIGSINAFRAENIFVKNSNIDNCKTGFSIRGKVLFENNTITNCQTAVSGIIRNSMVSNNSISNCENGFRTNSNSTYFSNNELRKICNIAIEARDGQSGNNIFENNILINCGHGIFHFDDDKNNIIRSNRFIDISGYYINVSDESSDNVTIYDNAFISSDGTPIRCNDDIEVSWDHEERGNFWSDYTDRYPYAVINKGGYWETPYDIEGDANSQDNYPLTGITDSNPPLIKDRSNEVGYTGDPFHFNFTVKDNLHFDRIYIKEIFLEYKYGTVSDNVSIPPTEEGTYNHSIQVPLEYDGELNYRIRARDLFGNWDNTGWKTVDVLDNNIPELVDVRSDPTIGESGGSVNISISYDDNIGVEKVWINGSYSNIDENIDIELTEIGDSSAGHILYIPYDVYGWFNFTVSLFDERNVFRSSLFFLKIDDRSKPEIDEILSPEFIYNNDTVVISADINDNIEIANAFLEYQVPNRDVENISFSSMIEERYSFTVFCPIDANGTLIYRLTARDVNDNWIQTGWYDLDILDNIKPQLKIYSYELSVFTGCEYVLEFDARDNIDVDRLDVEIIQDGTQLDHELIQNDIYQCMFTCPYDEDSDIEITIEASDRSLNLNSTKLTLVVVDNILPEMDYNVSFENGRLELEARISDNIGIYQVYLLISEDNHTLVSSNDVFTFNDRIDIDDGQYDVILVTLDVNSNMNITKVISIEIDSSDVGSGIDPLLLAILIIMIVLLIGIPIFFMIRKISVKDDGMNKDAVDEQPKDVDLEGSNHIPVVREEILSERPQED